MRFSQSARGAAARGYARGKIGYILLWLLGVPIPVLFLITLISFSLMQLVPGDPAILIAGLQATPAEVEQVRHELGLDQPFHIQLLT